MSMDTNGKIIWAKHSEIQQANLKAMGDAEIKDGERLPLAVKDMGSCEIYPQTIQHNPNGRYTYTHRLKKKIKIQKQTENEHYKWLYSKDRLLGHIQQDHFTHLCILVSPGLLWCAEMESTSSILQWL